MESDKPSRSTLGTAASREAVRAYLRDIVGLGGTFTMLELRQAVPGANQVDRRMRELRQAIPPWVIHSSQSDPNLSTDSYRVDFIGGDRLAKAPSAKVRRQVFEAADHRCQVCGIGLGEEYAEYPGVRARLQLGHWIPLDQGGSPTLPSNLRAECHMCNGGIRHLTGATPTAASLEARIRALPRRQRAELFRWMMQSRRDVDPVESLFYEFRQIPVESRNEILESLRWLVERDSSS
jgi:hypothetical protein